jgi:hypothetical protein
MSGDASDEPVAVLPWAGREIIRVAVDSQLRLLFDDGAELVVAAPLTLTGPAATDTVAPGELGTLAPALTLLWQTATAAVVDADDVLVLTFRGGTVLRVPAHPHYEAWNATGAGWNGKGADDWMVVSTPGGRLAVWGEPPEGGRFPADAH